MHGSVKQKGIIGEVVIEHSRNLLSMIGTGNFVFLFLPVVSNYYMEH